MGRPPPSTAAITRFRLSASAPGWWGICSTTSLDRLDFVRRSDFLCAANVVPVKVPTYNSASVFMFPTNASYSAGPGLDPDAICQEPGRGLRGHAIGCSQSVPSLRVLDSQAAAEVFFFSVYSFKNIQRCTSLTPSTALAGAKAYIPFLGFPPAIRFATSTTTSSPRTCAAAGAHDASCLEDGCGEHHEKWTSAPSFGPERQRTSSSLPWWGTRAVTSPIVPAIRYRLAGSSVSRPSPSTASAAATAAPFGFCVLRTCCPPRPPPRRPTPRRSAFRQLPPERLTHRLLLPTPPPLVKHTTRRKKNTHPLTHSPFLLLCTHISEQNTHIHILC